MVLKYLNIYLPWKKDEDFMFFGKIENYTNPMSRLYTIYEYQIYLKENSTFMKLVAGKGVLGNALSNIDKI